MLPCNIKLKFYVREFELTDLKHLAFQCLEEHPGDVDVDFDPAGQALPVSGLLHHLALVVVSVPEQFPSAQTLTNKLNTCQSRPLLTLLIQTPSEQSGLPCQAG